jgi:hypothetical protein
MPESCPKLFWLWRFGLGQNEGTVLAGIRCAEASFGRLGAKSWENFLALSKAVSFRIAKMTLRAGATHWLRGFLGHVLLAIGLPDTPGIAFAKRS